MRRILLLSPAFLLLPGCVVRTVTPVETTYVPPPEPTPVVVATPAPPPPAPAEVWYYDPHFLPEEQGGGWCYAEGPHRHAFYPDVESRYVLSGGYYYYSGPLVFLYVSGHPRPGGGWCPISGRHHHDYVPPRDRDFRWNRGHGWRYVGPYRATRPPPPSYWARPVPLPRPRPVPAPAPAPRPVVNRPAPVPARPVPPRHDNPGPIPPHRNPSPVPAPSPWHDDHRERDRGPDRDRPGHSEDAPAHGGA
ncbi:MAG TPA: hypothetical protein VD838_09765, partial [Anaeromyxobacteraceae bacterium]|nr:hypothetical protein [Anaeromyxobacteraceae bacterium]